MSAWRDPENDPIPMDWSTLDRKTAKSNYFPPSKYMPNGMEVPGGEWWTVESEPVLIKVRAISDNSLHIIIASKHGYKDHRGKTYPWDFTMLTDDSEDPYIYEEILGWQPLPPL